MQPRGHGSRIETRRGFDALRPHLLALSLVYWALEAPGRGAMTLAWVVGLFADVVGGTMLGEQALRMAVLLWDEHAASAQLPPWRVVGVEVVDRETFHRRGRYIHEQPGLVAAGRVIPF